MHFYKKITRNLSELYAQVWGKYSKGWKLNGAVPLKRSKSVHTAIGALSEKLCVLHLQVLQGILYKEASTVYEELGLSGFIGNHEKPMLINFLHGFAKLNWNLSLLKIRVF